MTASNDARVVDTLLRKWETENVRIGDANQEKRIEEFEEAHRIKLPEDFKRYLLKANGMQPGAPHDTDKNGYCFWPIQRIRSAAVELQEPHHYANKIDLANPELLQYFIFADYLQWSWAFAIRISESAIETSEVFRVDGPKIIVKVANSFAEFVDLYLIDDVRLYDLGNTANFQNPLPPKS
jgi:hypothetical protein